MAPKNTVLMIVDFNNLFYRTAHINQHLSFKGKRTGCIYGFTKLLSSYINEHKPTHIIVVNDKPPYKRKELFPGYKADRPKADPEFYSYIQESKNYCKELIERLNIPYWSEIGYEADDLIAESCYQYNDSYNKIVICSNDDDLYQLLVYSNVILQRSKDCYTATNFVSEFGIEPNLWDLVKSFSGNHNGVSNLYKGLGLKTAIKIVKDKKLTEELFDKYDEEIYNNFRLVTIPFDAPNFTIPSLHREKFNQRTVELWLTQNFGISMTSQITDSLETLNENL